MDANDLYNYISYQRIAGKSGSIQIAATFPQFEAPDGVEFSHSRPGDPIITTFLFLVAAHHDKEILRCMQKALMAYDIDQVREVLNRIFPLPS